MENTLETVCKALDDLADSITKAYTDDRSMAEIWGWNNPPLNRHDLADLSRNIAQKIRNNNIERIDEEMKIVLEKIPKRINLFKAHNLPYLFNGHGVHAHAVYTSLLEWINAVLSPVFGWQVLQDNKALPSALARRLRSIQAELNEMLPEKETLQKQLHLIQEATEAAESLPTDLERLREAKSKTDKFALDAAELYGKIDTYFKDADRVSKVITAKKEEADKLVAQCEEAYKITTTKGLAAAFDQRATKLAGSMWVWVIGLLIALGASIYIGTVRFDVLNVALEQDRNIGYIWTQIFLSVLSFGAPIWLAWISTKQIGQRFKLAEDYAYKASLAKAYEGYRREAARIEKTLETRLFSSALARLEEAPLRLVEEKQHGSPWQELVSSPQFQAALEKTPELREKLSEILSSGMARWKPNK